MSQRSSHTHCQVAQADARPKLVKECTCPTHGRQRNSSKLKDKMTEMNQHQAVTKCINHWADSANFKGVTFNKICSGLKGMSFEMPNASYTKPLCKIKICKK